MTPAPKAREPELSTNYNFPRLIRIAADLNWRMRPIVTPSIIGLVSLPSVYVFGSASPVLVFAGFSLLLAFGLWLANQIFQRLLVRAQLLVRSIIFAGLLLVAAMPPAYYTIWMIGFAQSRPADFHRSAILIGIGFAMIALLASTVDATAQALTRVETELEDAVSDLRWHLAKTKGQMWQRQQALARALHGPVQALLTAHTIRIDLAKSDATKTELAETAIADSIHAVSELENFIAGEVDFLADLQTACERWAGICRVDRDLAPAALTALSADPTASRITLDMIQDGISNSVRHGAATAIKLTVRLAARDQVLVEIADNGGGFTEPISPGLGSNQLDSLAISWTLRALNPGAILTFAVPVAG